jgi:hypothetical protein
MSLIHCWQKIPAYCRVPLLEPPKTSSSIKLQNSSLFSRTRPCKLEQSCRRRGLVSKKKQSPLWTVCNFENSLSPTHFFWRTQSNTRQNNLRWVPSSSPFIMDGRHPEWPPRRAALPISSADSGACSVAARWSWAASGLSSGRFAAIVTVI